MKKTYLTPDLFVMPLHTEDVITNSPINVVESGDGDIDYLEFPI